MPCTVERWRWLRSWDHHVIRDAVVPSLSVRSVGAALLRRSKAVSRMQDAGCRPWEGLEPSWVNVCWSSSISLVATHDVEVTSCKFHSSQCYSCLFPSILTYFYRMSRNLTGTNDVWISSILIRYNLIQIFSTPTVKYSTVDNNVLNSRVQHSNRSTSWSTALHYLDMYILYLPGSSSILSFLSTSMPKMKLGLFPMPIWAMPGTSAAYALNAFERMWSSPTFSSLIMKVRICENRQEVVQISAKKREWKNNL